MKYEKKSFWWGFAGGASAAYAFVFLVIFTIAIALGLPLSSISLLLVLISGIFAILIIFGRVVGGLESKGNLGRNRR